MTFELAPEPVAAWLCIPATAFCPQVVVLLAWLACILSGLSSCLGVRAMGSLMTTSPGPEITGSHCGCPRSPGQGGGSLAPQLGPQCW